MTSPAMKAVRRGALRLGTRLGTGTLEKAASLHSYLEIGGWLAAAGQPVPPERPTRCAVFEDALTRVRGQCPLYLEFGVFEGESLRWWSEHLTALDARLVGFDSFEGLPTNWRSDSPKGTFDVAGNLPRIDDPRVSYQVGWFDATLPGFAVPEHDQLVVNIDCDLYSSTVLVLAALEQELVPGTLIYFDEFNDRDHEQRAFREFLERTGLGFTPLSLSNAGVNWLFELTGPRDR